MSQGVATSATLRAYQALTQRRLDRLLDALFAEFTGIHFHVAWSEPSLAGGGAHVSPLAFTVCRRLSQTGAREVSGCRACGPGHLATALRRPAGHRFVCRLGVANYWLPIRVCDEMLGVAYLQAPDGAGARQDDGRDGAPPDGPWGKHLTRQEFARAARLLRFIIGSVEDSSTAHLQKSELAGARHAVAAMECEQARLHDALRRHLPDFPAVVPRARPRSHGEQIIEQLLQFLSANYARPLTLRHCAEQLYMNPAYLSALFSRTVGVPFKAHLTGLRIDKAMELLGDPARNISAVALAVGYASEDRFRRAFKQRTGLCPTVWRATMQAEPPKP